MVPHIATIDEILGPVLGPKVTAILDKNPPGNGNLVEIAIDNSAVRWVDASGTTRYLDLRSRGVWFGEDEDDDQDDDGEQVA